MTTEQKELPPGWKWVKLGDAGTITDGDWILKQHYSSEEEVRLLQVGDIGTGFFIGKSSRYISENTSVELGCTLLEENDILISRMPDPIGRACLLPKLPYKSITAVDVSIYRPNPVLLDNTFALHYMCSSDWLFKATSMARGATRQRVSRRNLETIPIPLPPLEEQKRISGLLNKAEEIKKLREEADKKTEELIPGIFHEMVGGRIKKGEELPSGWKWMKLWEVCDVRDGTHDTPKYVSEGIPLITSKNLKPYGLDFDDTRNISYEDYLQIGKRSGVDVGDVLYSMIGTIGNPVVVDTQRQFAIKNVALFKLQESQLDPRFFVHTMQSIPVVEQITAATKGGVQRFVSLKALRNLSFPLAPLKEQQEISARLREAERIKNTNAESGKKIEDLKSSLLQMAFRGDL